MGSKSTLENNEEEQMCRHSIKCRKLHMGFTLMDSTCKNMREEKAEEDLWGRRLPLREERALPRERQRGERVFICTQGQTLKVFINYRGGGAQSYQEEMRSITKRSVHR